MENQISSKQLLTYMLVEQYKKMQELYPNTWEVHRKLSIKQYQAAKYRDW